MWNQKFGSYLNYFDSYVAIVFTRESIPAGWKIFVLIYFTLYATILRIVILLINYTCFGKMACLHIL